MQSTLDTLKQTVNDIDLSDIDTLKQRVNDIDTSTVTDVSN